MSETFSDLKVFTIKNPTGTLVGNGSVTVGGLVSLRFTIIKGTKGVFASLPATKGSKPDENGKIPWYPQVKILDEEKLNEFQVLVKKEFARLLGAGSSPKPAPKGQAVAGEENQTGYSDDLPF